MVGIFLVSGMTNTLVALHLKYHKEEYHLKYFIIVIVSLTEINGL